MIKTITHYEQLFHNVNNNEYIEKVIRYIKARKIDINYQILRIIIQSNQVQNYNKVFKLYIKLNHYDYDDIRTFVMFYEYARRDDLIKHYIKLNKFDYEHLSIFIEKCSYAQREDLLNHYIKLNQYDYSHLIRFMRCCSFVRRVNVMKHLIKLIDKMIYKNAMLNESKFTYIKEMRQQIIETEFENHKTLIEMYDKLKP